MRQESSSFRKKRERWRCSRRLLLMWAPHSVAVATAPGAEAVPVQKVRIGLWDRYGGSMPSGWTRWILEQFEFSYQRVYAPELDKGGLSKKFDVLVFVDGAISASRRTRRSRRQSRSGRRRSKRSRSTWRRGSRRRWPSQKRSLDSSGISRPARQRSAATTIPQLKKFMEEGGTILTIGGSTSLARELGLPVSNHLVEVDENGDLNPLPAEKYYVPASVLRVRIDPASPLALGVGNQVDVVFSNSPTFRLGPNAQRDGVLKVAWFDSKTPLRSGWAWGQQYLLNGVAIADAKVGRGRLVLFGPEVLFRGQPHGTFKLFFNGLVQAGRTE